ncbi:MAG: F0F1 ATP synthase subunit A [Chloroflexi bacterium]|nr:F0F1 ATP synthase subunit A [Chloroflexota bacterium]
MEDIFPRVVFTFFGIPVRDTIISTWVMMVIIIGAAIWLRRRYPMALEMLVDFINDLITDIMGRSAAPFLPLLSALAIFIAVANIIGVVPFLISPTRDVNTPLALALVVFFSVHYFGIRSKGAYRYVRDMASPIYLLPLEIVSQLTRTLSLTLRLFGNILSTEMIIAVIFILAPLFVPLPLVGFSIFVGLLQAYIFTALAAVYIVAGLEANTPPSNAS